jgi:hypothetical protein
MPSRTKTNVVSEQFRTRVRTSYHYRENKLLLKPEQDIVIVKTTLYVFSNKQNKVLEQMRTTARTTS